MKHVYYIMVISIILNGWFLLERVEWMILLSDVLMSESRFFTFADLHWEGARKVF